MWSADPAYWAKTSPVLFPIVGALKEDTYFYKGGAYSLPRHGFARNEDFKLTEHHKHTITFSIESNPETLGVYPFPFTFSITYALENNELATSYIGLWAAPGADFICIEPWCGIADSVDADQQLEHKEGILRLLPSGSFEVQWKVHVY
jgi:galactose mutarotase-like enzyme